MVPSSIRVRQCVGQGKSDDGVPNGHGIRSGGDHQADDGAESEFDESAHRELERVSKWQNDQPKAKFSESRAEARVHKRSS